MSRNQAEPVPASDELAPRDRDCARGVHRVFTVRPGMRIYVPASHTDRTMRVREVGEAYCSHCLTPVDTAPPAQPAPATPPKRARPPRRDRPGQDWRRDQAVA